MRKRELRESLGLAAVVLGLVFVGLEMRQNTQMMQAQIRNAITENTMEYVSMIATSEGVTKAMTTAAEEGVESLSSQQRMHLVGYTHSQFRAWENEHYQNKVGLFTEEEFLARKLTWHARLLGSSFREVQWSAWDNNRLTFAPDFRAEIDAIIAEARQAQ